jgi:leucyl aminopeptidase
VGDEVAAALAEGTVLAAYRFDRYKSPSAEGDRGVEGMVVAAHDDVAEATRRGALVAAAVNRARDLQNTPANDMTPTRLAEAARALADEVEGVRVEVEDREGIEALGMGCLAGVARGSAEEPALITLRYDGPEASGRVLGLVGKAVAFDTGGISLKPVEIHNTDAEGRLVLADCLVHAVREGAERLVDVGAIVTALGSARCGLMASDDAWAAEVEAAARRSGELAWRLPLHPDYDELLSSQVADVVNVNEARKAGSIVAAQFLQRFTGDVPWAHLDIAGTAWGVGKPYAPKGGWGFGVRLLVELARGEG